MGPDDFKTVEEWYEFWKSHGTDWEIMDWDGFYGITKDQLITYNQFLNMLQACTMKMKFHD